MAMRKNRLLTRFPPALQGKLSLHREEVDLSTGHVLHKPNNEIASVYFPLDCIVSVTITMADAGMAQTGIVGNREMVGLDAFMGGKALNQTAYVVEMPGKAVRVPADILLAEFDTNKALRDVLLRYTQFYVAQLSQNVGCLARHSVSKRLARWLLEMSDRAGNELNLTHERIGLMLGVRRAGVSEELQRLAERGLIATNRKSVMILDTDGLAGAACECYSVLQREYDRLLGKMGAEFDA